MMNSVGYKDRVLESGFSLIEMAIVLVILGIMATVLIPPFVSSVKYEKRAENKDALNAVKLGVIGYAKGKKGLPGSLGSASLATRDVWGRDYEYLVADNLVPDDSICVENATSSETIRTASREQDGIAFAVASRGREVGGDSDGDYENWDVSDAGDDLVEFVTLRQLKYLVCDSGPGGGGPGGGGFGGVDHPSSNLEDYYYDGYLIIPKNSDENRNIFTTGGILIEQGASVAGNVSSEKYVAIDKNAKIGGSIFTNDGVGIGQGVSIDGEIHSEKYIAIDKNAQIAGSIFTNDGVGVGQGVSIDGEIHSEKYVAIDKNAQIGGNIFTNDGAGVGENSQIIGDVNAFRYVNISKNVSIGGSIYNKNGGIFLGKNVSLKKDAWSENYINHSQEDEKKIHENETLVTLSSPELPQLPVFPGLKF
jgi:prepilin-type N-terminal cleavage/methylation domain-containing protein